MKPTVLVRRVHYWVSIAIALPALVLIGSGLLLQTKKHWSWVQPEERRGSSATPRITLEAMLESLAAAPALGVRSWDDINRIDVRPARGVAKVWLHSGYEAQVDLGTGAILHHAYRRSDLIEAIHDGSFFGGDWTKLGIFLPTGVCLFFLWATGLFLFFLPVVIRRRKGRSAGPAGASGAA